MPEKIAKTFRSIDCRTVAGRRFRDLVRLLFDDLGGEQGQPQWCRSLVFQAAALQLEGEQIHENLLSGKDADFDIYLRLSGALRRIFETLGLPRRKTDPSDTLEDYLAKKESKRITFDDDFDDEELPAKRRKPRRRLHESELQ